MSDPLEDALQQVAAESEEKEIAPVETDVTTLPVSDEETTVPVDTDVTTEPVDTDVTTLPVDTEVTTLPSMNIDNISTDDALKVFNKITGLNLESSEKVDEFSKVWEKLPEYQKNINLFPKLVEHLKSSKDVLSHFQDETAYKVSQIAKTNSDYKGKEAVLNTVMRSDISKLSDIQVLKVAAELVAPDGVRNPLRAKISSMGLDPDEVINDYEELSDDDKDTLAMAAGVERRTLEKVGSDIEMPETVDDVLAGIEADSKAVEDDLIARKEKMEPIAAGIVDELKELPITSDFNFAIEMSNEEKTEFAELLSETLVSGNFDVSTQEGKEELWEVLQDAVWLSKKDDIMKAYKTDLTAKADEAARIKYNNETPLGNKEPVSREEGGDKDPVVSLVEEMIEANK